MSIRRIAPHEAREFMDRGYVYLDVRSTVEFEQGHPTGAINIPLADFVPNMGMVANSDFLSVVERVFPKDARLIIGCQAGNRSMHAANMMLEVGYPELLELRTGFGGQRNPFTGQVVEAGWADSGLPVARGQQPGSYALVKSGAQIK